MLILAQMRVNKKVENRMFSASSANPCIDGSEPEVEKLNKSRFVCPLPGTVTL